MIYHQPHLLGQVILLCLSDSAKKQYLVSRELQRSCKYANFHVKTTTTDSNQARNSLNNSLPDSKLDSAVDNDMNQSHEQVQVQVQNQNQQRHHSSSSSSSSSSSLIRLSKLARFDFLFKPISTVTIFSENNLKPFHSDSLNVINFPQGFRHWGSFSFQSHSSFGHNSDITSHPPKIVSNYNDYENDKDDLTSTDITKDSKQKGMMWIPKEFI